MQEICENIDCDDTDGWFSKDGYLANDALRVHAESKQQEDLWIIIDQKLGLIHCVHGRQEWNNDCQQFDLMMNNKFYPCSTMVTVLPMRFFSTINCTGNCSFISDK